jgi:phosphohistidine phosphatase
VPDHDRPLAPRGRRALESLRRHIAAEALTPDLVLCSSAHRTIETLQGIRPALPAETTVHVESGLYGASADELLERLHGVDDDVRSVLVIGHNPGVEDLAALLSGHAEAFPTATLAELSFDEPWSELKGGVATVRGFWTPHSPG